MLVAAVALALSGTPATNLRVAVWPQGRGGAARTSTLHCPSAVPACRKLGVLPGNPFAPTPPGIACMQLPAHDREPLSASEGLAHAFFHDSLLLALVSTAPLLLVSVAYNG